MAVYEKKKHKTRWHKYSFTNLTTLKKDSQIKKNLFNFYQLQCISTPIVILLVINFDLKLWAGNNENSLKKTSFHGYWFTFKKDGYSWIKFMLLWAIVFKKTELFTGRSRFCQHGQNLNMALWNSSIHRAQPDVESIIFLKLAAFHFSWKVKDKDL